jgi:hypothetical protein
MLLAAPIQAAFAPARMSDVFDAVPIIVDATIMGARASRWDHRNGTAICGTTFDARIHQSFKGGVVEALTFATDGPLSVPGRYVLFLYRSSGRFPTDTYVKLTESEESELDACVRELPQLRATWVTAIEIADSDLARFKAGFVPPEELSEFAFEANLLPYERVREWIVARASASDR